MQGFLAPVGATHSLPPLHAAAAASRSAQQAIRQLAALVGSPCIAKTGPCTFIAGLARRETPREHATTCFERPLTALSPHRPPGSQLPLPPHWARPPGLAANPAH